MAPLKSSSLCKLAFGISFLIANTFAKISFREIQVKNELERFERESENSEGLFSITAEPYIPPAVYLQTVDVCYIFHLYVGALWTELRLTSRIGDLSSPWTISERETRTHLKTGTG